MSPGQRTVARLAGFAAAYVAVVSFSGEREMRRGGAAEFFAILWSVQVAFELWSHVRRRRTRPVGEQ
jgi:hypothetical protein